MIDFRHIPLSHDFAFGDVMRVPALCRCFLETVLQIKINRLEFIEKQADLSDSPVFHGIRLDVYIEDGADTVYNIEMQNRLESFERIRYYQAGIDRRTLEKGEPFTKLKTSYIIMVCNYDPTKDSAGLRYPLYERECRLICPEGSDRYEDGSHVILLNTRYDKRFQSRLPEVCEFLDLINCTEDVLAESFRYPLSQLAAQELSRFRRDEAKGAIFMTVGEKIKEEAWYAKQEGIELGKAEGAARKQAENIEKLMSRLKITREEAEKLLS